MVKLKKPIPLPRLDFTDKKQGFIALGAAILVAIILGVIEITLGTALIHWLLAAGVIVGILNIFHEEGILFVLSGLTLVLMLNLLAGLALFPAWAIVLFNAVIYLLAPTLAIVSLKVLYALAVK